MLSCDFLQIDVLYAIKNVQSMFVNFFIHIRRIVFSLSFFGTDWVESTQCDYRQMNQRWKQLTFGSKKAKTVSSAGKVMATVSLDARVIILLTFCRRIKSLCNTSKPLAQKTANGTSKISARKKLFSSRQRTDSHFRSFNGKRAWMRVQTVASSTLFSWFGSSWLLSISKC